MSSVLAYLRDLAPDCREILVKVDGIAESRRASIERIARTLAMMVEFGRVRAQTSRLVFIISTIR